MNSLIRLTQKRIKTRSICLMTSKATDYNESYSTKKQEQPDKIIHSGGFKRDHDDNETKKSFFNYDDEKWFSEQLSSGETYRTNIVHKNGYGKIMFRPK